MATQEILFGPSKWELMIIFFHNEMPAMREHMTLKTRTGLREEMGVTVKIMGIDEGNPAEQTWKIRGEIVNLGWCNDAVNKPCEINYSTRTRKGELVY